MNSVKAVLSGLLISTHLISGTQPAASQPSPDQGPRCTSDVMLVLDGSGSMSAADFVDGAPNRMDRVRQALGRVVPEVAPVRRLGLVIYGPGSESNSCRNIELRLRPQPDAAQTILDMADRIRPAGRTPLARSVEIAAEVFMGTGQTAEIVLLTDGEDTCGRDPCSLARQLKSKAPTLVVHVVGFRLPARSETIGARCLADQTGGTFVTTETTAQLTEALRQTLSCPELSLEQTPPATQQTQNGIAMWIEPRSSRTGAVVSTATASHKCSASQRHGDLKVCRRPSPKS